MPNHDTKVSGYKIMSSETRATKEVSYPSKEEIIDALKEEEIPKGFEQFLVLLEFNKKSDKLCLIKGELLQNEDVVLRGKLTVIPEMTSNPTQWNKMEVGESKIIGFSLEYQGETLFDIIREGFKDSLSKGRIPFCP